VGSSYINTVYADKGKQMSERASKHYDNEYFNWQASIGEFGGWADQSKFAKYISNDDDVLDFGCGGGFLLRSLNCKKKVGIEVNPEAIETAKKNGIEVYISVEAIPDEYVDIVISNHALEHALQPLDELKSLWKKLRSEGRIIFVVPCESISCSYRPNNINHHLYSWSPMCIGNLFIEAGFSLVEVKPYIHKWPPYYALIARFGGRQFFEIACRIYGHIERSWFQVRAIGEKKNG